MADKKPSVIPSQEEIASAKASGSGMNKISNTPEPTKELDPKADSAEVSQAESKALESMREAREKEQAIIKNGGKIIRPDLAEAGAEYATVQYGSGNNDNGGNTPIPPSTPPIDMGLGGDDNLPEKPDYSDISQPDDSGGWDIIPLPSKGLLYPNKQEKLKVGFLTAADENILTNPNLMESGDFLEILFNRKILDPSIRYKDLNVGDRNAIMIWLRATAYGEMYPVDMIDPKDGETFKANIDLSKLKTVELNVTPDSNGLFDFTLPVSKKLIKFKLLTVGDIDDIEEHVDSIKRTYGNHRSDAITYTLSKEIIEVDGDRSVDTINKFSNNMRAGDSKALRNYIDSIECGVDLSVTLGTPGGGSIDTFLPLNVGFFWPDLLT
jgi:hypothetical protein